MVVLDANLGDSDIEQEIEKIKGYVTSEGGEIGAVDLWGRRKLAYEIDRHKDGYYAVIKFKAEPKIVAPLVKSYRLNEQILRHIVVSDNFKEPIGIPEGRRRGDEEDDEPERGYRSDSRGED
jgi:small subunit ribosomal protein S6